MSQPLLLSGPMVLAKLAGVKIETRRIAELPDGIKPEYFDNSRWYPDAYNGGPFWNFWGKAEDNKNICGLPQFKCPYGGIGDIAHFRESWRTLAYYDNIKPSQLEPTSPILYEADFSTINYGMVDPDDEVGKLRPSIFLPKWAWRGSEIITRLRVERLLDITEQGAIDEGFASSQGFLDYWDSLNAKRGYPVADNPFVWVIGWDR